MPPPHKRRIIVIEDISPELYGDLHASNYDALFGGIDDNARGGALLHELAGEGDALEFGIGTGRLAIPLAELGTHVHGVDISEPMLQRLREKIADHPITPIRGDFVEFTLGQPVSLVYSVFSTIFMLGEQRRQVNCLKNAAAHLEPGGRVLLDMFVHDRTRFVNNQETVTIDVEVESADFRLARLEPNLQVLNTQRVRISEGETRMIPNRLRFIYPSELDLMAELAGLAPKAKWSDWSRSPFTATSDNLIAVYEKV